MSGDERPNEAIREGRIERPNEAIREGRQAEEIVRPTAPFVVALAWLVVLIPLGWGVYQTLVNALPLFQG